MAKVKCRVCKKMLLKSEAYTKEELTLKGLPKIVYLHNDCKTNYNQLLKDEAKEKENKGICKYCKRTLKKDESHVIIETNIDEVEIKIFLHNECINDYEELMEYKKHEVIMFNQMYEYIIELLGYSSQQTLSIRLITKLQEMRNGTIEQKGMGKIIKSKEGYPYAVIYDTLLSNADAIRWAMTNKTFKNEANKESYLFAIICSHINDTYIRFQNAEDFNNVKTKNNMIEEEKEVISIIRPKIENKINKGIGISKFLDDDEF